MKSINTRICLLGGWAVYYTVNDYFSNKKKRPYLGSRDIDFGIYLKPMMGKSELISTTLFKVLTILESEGFQAEGIRYRKDITYKSKDLNDEKIKEESFPLYIDIIVNSYPLSYSDIIHQYFFEESLVEIIYSNRQNQVDIPKISNLIFMPIPEILIACKIRAIPGRDTQHKRVKDICDLYSLLFYTAKSFDKTVNELKKYIQSDAVIHLKNTINKEMMEESERKIGEPSGSINTVIGNLFNEFGI